MRRVVGELADAARVLIERERLAGELSRRRTDRVIARTLSTLAESLLEVHGVALEAALVRVGESPVRRAG